MPLATPPTETDTPAGAPSSTIAAPAPGRARTLAPSWRAALLPLAAAAFLAAGGVAWLVGGGVVAARVWYAGLVVAGAPAVWQTVRGMFRGHFASDIVATLAILTAAILAQPLAGLVVVLMQTGGEALERYAEGRASAAVRALEAAAPRLAHRIDEEGRVHDIAAEDARVDDLILVRPGELVPCDGVVVDGYSHVDAARLTGEPVPVSASAGTRLMSGSANGEGPLTVRVLAPAGESQYARIVELVRSAQASKAPLQRLADRYATWFTPITLVVCALAWLASGDVYRVLAVLVVATPCPLILATPIAIIGGINRAAARQIIVRHGGALEQLGVVNAAVFDKTGTLTIGRPEVDRVETLGAWSERELLRLAGAVEQGSSHLLARSLVEAAHAATGHRVLPAATAVTEAAGRGVSGTVEGHRVDVGARAFVLDHAPGAAAGIATLDARFARDEGLRAYVLVDGAAAGVVEYADRIRESAIGVLADLDRLGVRRTVLLSGDHQPNVRAVADAVGVREARGELLPEDKVTFVRELVDSGARVVMVGDGTNDAPALSTATVGVALAGSEGHGSGITAEAADVVILADELGRLPEAIRISRRTMSVARQSLVAGLGLSAVAMVFAALGHIAPVAGALIQEVIDIAVIVNALRASA